MAEQGTFTVHTKTYRFPTSTRIQYYGRVEGLHGWWKTSREFDFHVDARVWCLNRLKERGLQPVEKS